MSPGLLWVIGFQFVSIAFFAGGGWVLLGATKKGLEALVKKFDGFEEKYNEDELDDARRHAELDKRVTVIEQRYKWSGEERRS